MLDLPLDPLLLVPFLLAALLYSTVGHGGASAYLALFALAGIHRGAAVPAALMMNLLVAGMAFRNYRQAGHFDPRLLAPFALFSIPAAFLGAAIPLDPAAYSLLLGAALLAAATRFLIVAREPKRMKIRVGAGPNFYAAAGLGVGLGLLAGMTGIGGGVYLTPLLLFLGWADAKKAAAVSGGFILLNSVSGLASRSLQGVSPEALMLVALLVPVVLAGGWLGSHAGALRLSRPSLQRVLGLVLGVAGLKALVG
ncbi:MAG: sulfite exporter TauE/SafE family protein [Euryarchaeota archaeon]|nr:sulfite exporter TauE/SafE family protein [Euryarchaeota archaeon]